jgi:hypothetical protein
MKKRVVPSSRAQVYAEISKSESSLSSAGLTSLIPSTLLILHSNPYHSVTPTASTSCTRDCPSEPPPPNKSILRAEVDESGLCH